MPALQRTASSSSGILRAGFVALALAAVGFAACVDAIHLDPPGAGGGATSTSGGTGGSGCRSNPDCAYPKALCDTVSEACVECLVFSDCEAKPTTVCSKGSCVCPNPDGSPAPLAYCPGESKPACVDTQISTTDCGGCAMPCSGTCNAGTCMTGTGTGGMGTGGMGTGGSEPSDAGDDGG